MTQFYNAKDTTPQAFKNTCSPRQIVQQTSVAKVIFNFFQSLRNPIPEGSTGLQLERVAHHYLTKQGCLPALRGYNGFPSDISVSVNEVVAHGVPDDVLFMRDDIVVVDIVARARQLQLFADMSWSFCVGAPSDESRYLIASAWNISRAGACAVKAGACISDIAHAVQEEAHVHKCYVYTQFVGHAIGLAIHQQPHIRYDVKAPHTRIVPGMVLCIEPIVSLKPQKVQKRADNSYIGKRHYKTAVFEHMVAVFSSCALVISHGAMPPQKLATLQA